jgi:hypothetical protein
VEVEEEQDFVVTLASGGSVRVTPTSIEVQPADAAAAPDITDLEKVKSIRRVADYVIITRVRRRTMEITLASNDDAELLEARIRAGLDRVGVFMPSAAPSAQFNWQDRWLPISLVLCALLVIVGSLGPWATVVGSTISGMDGDGSLTLTFGVLAGVLAGILVWQPWRRGWILGLILLSFLLVALVGVSDWVDIGRIVDEINIDASVGWGLQLMTVAGCIGTALAFVQYRQGRRSRLFGRSGPSGTADDASL